MLPYPLQSDRHNRNGLRFIFGQAVLAISSVAFLKLFSHFFCPLQRAIGTELALYFAVVMQ